MTEWTITSGWSAGRMAGKPLSSTVLAENFGNFGDDLVKWPPKLRHGEMWKYGTALAHEPLLHPRS